MNDFLELLKTQDDPVYSEAPRGFNRRKAEVRFKKLATAVVEEFPGSRFETGAEIQDASFHGQIFVHSEGRDTLVRVSNFGNFVTFFGGEDDCLPLDVRDRLIELFVEHGYVFIPPEVLTAPYDGDNPGVSGFPDWGYRYFEWI